MAKIDVKLIVVAEEGIGGELFPTVIDAWDEYILDSNYEGFQDALSKAQEEYGRVVVVDTWYDDTEAMKLLDPANNAIKGRPESTDE